MKQSRNSDKKRHHEETIHDRQYRSMVKRYKWKNHAIIAGALLGFCVLLLFTIVSDIPLTAANVAVGLAVLNGPCWLLLRLLCRPAYNLSIQIPMKNDGHWLWRGGELIYRELTHDDATCPIPPEYLVRVDDRQIIIDNDSTSGRILVFLLFSFMFGLFIYWSFLSDSTVPPEDYGSALLFAEMGVILAWGMAYTLLNPRQRIVFDRTAKTVTIPGSLLMNKTETIPYDQAELSYYHDMRSKIDEVKIYNPSGLPHGISVMPGRTDEALRLARFIHRYMEEEVVDKAELEKFKNREKPQQEEMEYFNTW